MKIMTLAFSSIAARFLCIAGLVLALGSAAGAQGEWTALFNGKDLAGWEQKNGLAKYEAKDGCIVGISAPNSPNSFLCTKKDFADFRAGVRSEGGCRPELGRANSQPQPARATRTAACMDTRWRLPWAAFQVASTTKRGVASFLTRSSRPPRSELVKDKNGPSTALSAR